MPLAAWRESSLEGGKICYPSHKTTFVCLPVPSKPLTRLGEHTMATAPSLLSLCLLPHPPVFPPILFQLICQYNADIQRFVCTSSPRGAPAQNLLMRASQQWHTHKRRHESTHTQERKLIQKLIHSCQRQAFSLPYTNAHGHTHSPCLQPACSQRNEPKTNQQRVI